MAEYEDKLIRNIEQKSRKKVAKFSKKIVNAKSEDKKAIAAAMEFERWLSDSCCQCLNEEANC